jgi:hypothetical protein
MVKLARKSVPSRIRVRITLSETSRNLDTKALSALLEWTRVRRRARIPFRSHHTLLLHSCQGIGINQGLGIKHSHGHLEFVFKASQKTTEFVEIR